MEVGRYFARTWAALSIGAAIMATSATANADQIVKYSETFGDVLKTIDNGTTVECGTIQGGKYSLSVQVPFAVNAAAFSGSTILSLTAGDVVLSLPFNADPGYVPGDTSVHFQQFATGVAKPVLDTKVDFANGRIKLTLKGDSFSTATIAGQKIHSHALTPGSFTASFDINLLLDNNDANSVGFGFGETATGTTKVKIKNSKCGAPFTLRSIKAKANDRQTD